MHKSLFTKPQNHIITIKARIIVIESSEGWGQTHPQNLDKQNKKKDKLAFHENSSPCGRGKRGGGTKVCIYTSFFALSLLISFFSLSVFTFSEESWCHLLDNVVFAEKKLLTVKWEGTATVPHPPSMLRVCKNRVYTLTSVA